MNISEISPAASISSLDRDLPANVSMDASVRVLGMAQQVFADVAEQLIAELAAMTGIGQNIDIYM